MAIHSNLCEKINLISYVLWSNDERKINWTWCMYVCCVNCTFARIRADSVQRIKEKETNHVECIHSLNMSIWYTATMLLCSLSLCLIIHFQTDDAIRHSIIINSNVKCKHTDIEFWIMKLNSARSPIPVYGPYFVYIHSHIKRKMKNTMRFIQATINSLFERWECASDDFGILVFD